MHPRPPARSSQGPSGRRGRFAALLLAAVLGCLGTGCGRSDRPPLGTVTGVVTLDGVPLAGGLVVFTPRGPGRSSQSLTDASGRYELAYLRDIKGADVGPHTVQITIGAENGRGGELLPARYHSSTELTATVTPGRNRFDFPLSSR